ncbi:MAG: hypothetical protein V4760_15115 [Bdellovibrionota bacterium]
MSSSLESLKIKAKLLQKAKKKIGQTLQLKDALDKIAQLSGFPNWRELKTVTEETEIFVPSPSSAFWKTWYASYEEALAHLAKGEGFLLPYRKQFFICDIHWIEHLGIAASDTDLALVGRNWVEPLDREAMARLVKKIRAKRAG